LLPERRSDDAISLRHRGYQRRGGVSVIGFIVTLGVTRGRYRIAAFVLLAVCLTHLGVMIADYRQDPGTHNLAPFEFLVLCFFAAAAFGGAFIAQIVDYVRTRGRT
jgi:hypothetical protein